jgi:hypothetical protein
MQKMGSERRCFYIQQCPDTGIEDDVRLYSGHADDDRCCNPEVGLKEPLGVGTCLSMRQLDSYRLARCVLRRTKKTRFARMGSNDSKHFRNRNSVIGIRATIRMKLLEAVRETGCRGQARAVIQIECFNMLLWRRRRGTTCSAPPLHASAILPQL